MVVASDKFDKSESAILEILENLSIFSKLGDINAGIEGLRFWIYGFGKPLGVFFFERPFEFRELFAGSHDIREAGFFVVPRPFPL